LKGAIQTPFVSVRKHVEQFILYKDEKLTCPNDMVFVPRGEFKTKLNKSSQKLMIDPFCIDKYETKQEDYEKVMNGNPSWEKSPKHPVNNIVWSQADNFCREINKRLPNEWEWEKAAKAGTVTRYYWGDKKETGYSNFCDKNCDADPKDENADDGYQSMSPVGKFKPNAWGIYDMLGNVWEWTSSWHTDREEKKILRGGSYNVGIISSGYRRPDRPTGRHKFVGFRCAKDFKIATQPRSED
jgi:formylglycine-generating enzyme